MCQNVPVPERRTKVRLVRLFIRRHLIEELHSCSFLDFLYRDCVPIERVRTTFVRYDESQCFKRCSCIVHDFEERVWNDDFATFADNLLDDVRGEDRTTHDQKLFCDFRIVADPLLELFPDASITEGRLGADVRHVERIIYTVH